MDFLIIFILRRRNHLYQTLLVFMIARIRSPPIKNIFWNGTILKKEISCLNDTGSRDQILNNVLLKINLAATISSNKIPHTLFL